MTPPQLLTDPFLQRPTATTVQVVWFTEFPGLRHTVTYGPERDQKAEATTTQLSRTREDGQSFVGNPNWQQLEDAGTIARPIWRHEATVTGLVADERWPYWVTSVREEGEAVRSDEFTLAAAPVAGVPLKILLTSDHQLKPMVAANLQKVVETIGRVDGVFFAGDLVNVPDRASEWFDDDRGNAFFPAFQGRTQAQLHQAVYRGGAILQHTPLFAAIGNHEVMGRFSHSPNLYEQFEDTVPRSVAYQALPPNPDLRTLKNHSFNTDTYEEIFSLPESESGGKRYYAVTFGDVRLVVLYVTNMWRNPRLDNDVRGKYRERQADLADPMRWGYGQHIYEPIAAGSPQYQWLAAELERPEFQQARFRVVMLHHPPHSLGENAVPAYTDPVQVVDRDASGRITAIRYEYPQAADYLVRDLVPLLEAAGVHLVFYGHSHLWNRFVSPTGMHFLETSNVGNSYGAYLGGLRRIVPTDYRETYPATGNPNGLEPIVPTLAPLLDDRGHPLPYLASNEITAFSILDTGTGTIRSYRFDTRQPDSEVIPFDEFSIVG